MDYLLPELEKRKICFVEINRPPDGASVEGKPSGEEQIPDILKDLKHKIPSVLLIGNGKFSPEEADKYIKAKVIDMVSMGTNYLSNPDLANRIKNNYPLNPPDWSTAYSGGEKGYTDIPIYTP